MPRTPQWEANPELTISVCGLRLRAHGSWLMAQGKRLPASDFGLPSRPDSYRELSGHSSTYQHINPSTHQPLQNPEPSSRHPKLPFVKP